MYLVNHRHTQDADRAKVCATWKNRFHQSAAVFLNATTPAGEATQETVLIEGSVKDVHGALYGCAEIAWSMGWRPRGLMPMLLAFIQGFKIPPASRGGK